MTNEVGVALAIFFAALSGVFWRMPSLLEKAGSKGEVAQRDLAAHKLHVAETYVSKAGHREATDQVMDALEEQSVHRFVGQAQFYRQRRQIWVTRVDANLLGVGPYHRHVISTLEARLGTATRPDGRASEAKVQAILRSN